MNDKLVEYCYRHMSFIQHLYQYLLSDYVNEVNELFKRFIETEAELPNNRKKYRSICSIILIKYLYTKSIINESCKKHFVKTCTMFKEKFKI
ncbi:hypothetical protein CUU64_13720 [Bacillus sp. V5-8f]|nr:hypothetical protein CUU64_13720 [Bacillus sp. V5-8f]